MALVRQVDGFDFDELFREHAPGLLRLIRSRIGEPGGADDVLQETFIRFFRFYVVPGRLDPARPVGPLLATIALRETARRGRALGRQRRVDAAARPVALAAVGTDEHVAALHEARPAHVGRRTGARGWARRSTWPATTGPGSTSTG